jgi:hypothetical protein
MPSSNALAPTPTNSLAAYMQRQMGFDPNVERLSFLPYPQGALTKGAKIDWTNWVAPQVAYDAAKAYMLPGYAARGGQYAPEDVANMAMNVAGGGMAIGRAPANSLAMNVYHGTPHRFAATKRNPLGEFRSSQIGSGEGSQAYGHGLYLAEAPGTAKSYQIELARDPRNSVNKVISRLPKNANSDDVMFELRKHPDLVDFQNDSRLQNDILKIIQNTNADGTVENEAIRAYNRTNSYLPPADKGSFYHVDLPDPMIAKMLDYEKHLSEQAPEVQKILLPYQKEIGSSFGTGEQTLNAIAFERRMKGLDYSPAAVAKQLQEMGIPGVKYLDATSRRAGKGTRNFVVFPGEEQNLTILKRE